MVEKCKTTHRNHSINSSGFVCLHGKSTDWQVLLLPPVLCLGQGLTGCTKLFSASSTDRHNHVYKPRKFQKFPVLMPVSHHWAYCVIHVPSPSTEKIHGRHLFIYHSKGSFPLLHGHCHWGCLPPQINEGLQPGSRATMFIRSLHCQDNMGQVQQQTPAFFCLFQST